MKILFVILLLLVSAYPNELSVLGAGNLDSSSPYGLTKSEKAIYKNKLEIKKLKKDIKNLKYILNDKLGDIREQIDGFKSVYEGDSYSLRNILRETKKYSKSIKSNSLLINDISKKIDKLEERLDNLSNQLDIFIKTQKINNNNFDKNLKELSKVLNILNDDYVSKAKFKELVDFVNKHKIVKKEVTKNKNYKKTTSVTKKNLSNKDTLKLALKLYKQNYLTKSKPYFIKLFKKKYKIDIVGFYLGKIYYFKKQYKKSVFYFKKSMLANDESKFIPELLYYSAKSFEKLKDKTNAINFYNTLIDVYPENRFSIKAKKNLSKLK